MTRDDRRHRLIENSDLEYLGTGPGATGGADGWTIGSGFYVRCVRCGSFLSLETSVSDECECGSLHIDVDAGRLGTDLEGGDHAIEVYRQHDFGSRIRVVDEENHEQTLVARECDFTAIDLDVLVTIAILQTQKGHPVRIADVIDHLDARERFRISVQERDHAIGRLVGAGIVSDDGPDSVEVDFDALPNIDIANASPDQIYLRWAPALDVRSLG